MSSATVSHSPTAPHPSQRALLLKRRARFMRHNPTASEYRLWKAISAGKLGVTFRRQVVIGDFIADFCASGIKLVIEVNGPCHEVRLRLDAARKRKLERAGYAVVVVSDEQVMGDLPAVVRLVSDYLAQLGLAPRTPGAR